MQRTLTGHSRDERNARSKVVNNVIYIVGLVVVVLAVLSFFGMR